MTNRDIISGIRSFHKLLSSDSTLNDRAILQEVKSASAYLIRQQIEKRKLWQSDNIFTTIPCLEMKEVPLAECCNYISTKTVSRSVERMPTISDSLFGLIIKSFSSIDGSKPFIYTTPEGYVNALKLKLKTNNIFYWLSNGYLYCSLPTLRAANLVAYFEDEVPSSLLYPACDCAYEQPEDPCMNPLDRESKVPGFLTDAVKKMVSEKLLRTYYSIPSDKSSNQIDENGK